MLRDNQPLVLTVDSAGQLFLNVGEDEESAVNARRVVAMTAAVLRRKPATPVLVRADKAVAYGEVVRAMVLLQQAGAEKVGFVTDPPPEISAESGA